MHPQLKRRLIALYLAMIGCLLVAVCAAGNAHASANGTTTTPALDQTLHLADRFWTERNVQPCATAREHITLVRIDDAEIAGYGNPDTCEIQLDQPYVQNMIMPDRFSLAELCAMVVHELGHVRGLEHDDRDRYGVMTGRTISWRNAPYTCKRWARRTEQRMIRATTVQPDAYPA